MRVGWKLKAVCAFFFLQLYCRGCLSLNFGGLVMWAFRSRAEINPNGTLQKWEARDDNLCNWKGVHCVSGRVYVLLLSIIASADWNILQKPSGAEFIGKLGTGSQ